MTWSQDFQLKRFVDSAFPGSRRRLVSMLFFDTDHRLQELLGLSNNNNNNNNNNSLNAVLTCFSWCIWRFHRKVHLLLVGVGSIFRSKQIALSKNAVAIGCSEKYGIQCVFLAETLWPPGGLFFLKQPLETPGFRQSSPEDWINDRPPTSHCWIFFPRHWMGLVFLHTNWIL